jgi:iron complex outermembrane recepter protein
MTKIRVERLLATSAMIACLTNPAFSQTPAPPPEPAAPETPITAEPSENEDSVIGEKGEIVVTAPRIRGSVETKVKPIDELGEADVQALGATSIAQVVASVAAQSGSGRGRSSGPPIILLNGQRVSSFRELRDLPSDAIKKVEVFPEEVALQYGFRPDQRVINFILKDNFSSFSAEVEYGGPTQHSGFDRQEFQTTFTRIAPDTRFNIDIQLERRTAITEDERNILSSTASAPFALQGNISGLGVNGEIDPALSALAGRTVTSAAVPNGTNSALSAFAANANAPASGDIGQFRTLSPASQRFQSTVTWSKSLGKQSNLSFNASFEQQDQQSLLGLPSSSFTVPASSPFSPFSRDVVLNRYFDAPRPLSRDNTSRSLQFGAGYNDMIGDWRLALTGDYQISNSKSRTFTNADYTALRAGITAGTINPFAAELGSNLLFANPDSTESSFSPLSLRGTLSGQLFRLPAGPVQVTLRAGFDARNFDTLSTRRGITTDVSLSRNNSNAAFNVEVPLVERGTGAIGVIGDFSVNGNMGFTDVSDVGMLIEYGAGLRWSPAKTLSFSASLTGDENAPSLSQLGNPISITPNIAYFDFTRGESRFIELLSGGNPLLRSETRLDWIFRLDWQPKIMEGLGLQFEYLRNRSRNTTASFPLLTPEIEAAFPDRVTRDTSGQLLRLDQRPLNFERETSEKIRWGFNVSGNLTKQPSGMPGMMGRPGGSPPAAGAQGGQQPTGAGAGGPPGGRPRGAGGGPGGGPGGGGGGRSGFGGGRFGGGLPGMGGQPSRWQLALYHTYKLEEEILIRAGVPVLDLLNGSATGSLGGSPRHEVTLSGGVFHKGMGLRLEGSYRSATRVTGTSLIGSGDLRFGDLATLTTFIFFNFDQREKLIKKLPLLKGSRIFIRVDNVLNDVIDVRGANGRVPLSYQPGLLDPQGRVFEISFRKRF